MAIGCLVRLYLSTYLTGMGSSMLAVIHLLGNKASQTRSRMQDFVDLNLCLLHRWSIT